MTLLNEETLIHAAATLTGSDPVMGFAFATLMMFYAFSEDSKPRLEKEYLLEQIDNWENLAADDPENSKGRFVELMRSHVEKFAQDVIPSCTCGYADKLSIE